MNKKLKDRAMLQLGILSLVFILVKALIYFRWVGDDITTWVGAGAVTLVLYLLAR